MGGQVSNEITDHVSSVSMTLDAKGRVTSIEEYTASGDSALFLETGPTHPKRYRFAGKELDPESELYYLENATSSPASAASYRPTRSAPALAQPLVLRQWRPR
jgi:uncharacterized protein RhaS with RHS repeats